MPQSTLDRLAQRLPRRRAPADLRPLRGRRAALPVARPTGRSGCGSAARASRPRSSTTSSGSAPATRWSAISMRRRLRRGRLVQHRRTASRSTATGFRILGRVTDLINVGGQKVYPAEVEDVILAMDNVADVAVYGEHNALLGQIVVARVVTERPSRSATSRSASAPGAPTGSPITRCRPRSSSPRTTCTRRATRSNAGPRRCDPVIELALDGYRGTLAVRAPRIMLRVRDARSPQEAMT